MLGTLLTCLASPDGKASEPGMTTGICAKMFPNIWPRSPSDYHLGLLSPYITKGKIVFVIPLLQYFYHPLSFLCAFKMYTLSHSIKMGIQDMSNRWKCGMYQVELWAPSQSIQMLLSHIICMLKVATYIDANVSYTILTKTSEEPVCWQNSCPGFRHTLQQLALSLSIYSNDQPEAAKPGNWWRNKRVLSWHGARRLDVP